MNHNKNDLKLFKRMFFSATRTDNFTGNLFPCIARVAKFIFI